MADPDRLLADGREEQWQELLAACQRNVPALRGLAAALREAGWDTCAAAIDASALDIASAAMGCLDVTERIDPSEFFRPGER